MVPLVVAVSRKALALSIFDNITLSRNRFGASSGPPPEPKTARVKTSEACVRMSAVVGAHALLSLFLFVSPSKFPIQEKNFRLVGWSGGRFCSLLNRFSLSSLEKATILAWSENFAVPRVRGWKIFCSSSSTKNSGLICVRIECPSPVASNESAGPSGADLALRVKNELCGQ